MGLSCFKSWKHDSAGHKGNRDVLASPGSYFFLSNSAGQGDEWLKSLNKGVWIPFTGVFGQRLEETVLYERRYGVRLVPLVVEQCVSFIRERGLQEVGLFRQPGQASLVKELQEAFDAGERPSFDSNTDVHTVASLLKLYLRQLPEPLVPYSRFQDFLLCSQKLSGDRAQGLKELRNLLQELPVANFNLLSFICQFLNEVQSYSGGNKMSCQNLATVFGPNILRAKAEDPQSIMGATSLVQLLMLELIREHESLFSKVPPPVSARNGAGLRASRSPLMPPHLRPSPCLRQLSMPLISQRSQEPGLAAAADGYESSCVSSAAAANSDFSSGQKRLLGHRYTSSHPENCLYPDPSPGQPGRPDSAEYDRCHAADVRTSAFGLRGPWSEAGPKMAAWSGQGEPSGQFWCSAKGGPEAASGGSSDAQEDSTPSAYDNLDRVSMCNRMEDVADGPRGAGGAGGNAENSEEPEEAWQTVDSSSSWSSCEFLPLDKGDDGGDVGPDVSSATQERLATSPEAEEEESDGDEGDNSNEDPEEVHHPNSPASCSPLSQSPLSTGSSEVFLPSGPPDQPGNESRSQPDADVLLAELRQQMAQQKAEYQTRITRLERCNDVLERQVAVLRASLEQQRRSQSVAEIKIRNMERAKADADQRNTTLQREMELFFQMYGAIRRRDGVLKRERILQSL